MKPLLRVRDLRTYFDVGGHTVRAVDGVSFDLFPGETLGIVGESGCGKTVTTLSILKLIEKPGTIAPPSRVEYDGRDLLTLTPRDLRRVRGAEIAMVFQEPTSSLNPVLTVGRQITEAIRAHRDVDRSAARARAIELLARVGIPDPHKRIDNYILYGSFRYRTIQCLENRYFQTDLADFGFIHFLQRITDHIIYNISVKRCVVFNER